ncbi:hypothetical protein ET475_01035 [Microbacterium protaetiae]|uniref:Protein RecA n=2 Tax=Microbacterium protaetiae TaxID=2509458 RepID=A0A4P6EUC3_9MICO|nr:hypothetical protein [Microbacterium protaetiae]QAY61638.1 hypothetical protein ET475_01035 [Microbacterium protaetiae]
MSAGAATAQTEISRLRAQLERVQGRRLGAAVLPTLPSLAGLLPGGGLRAGAAYALAPSASLLLALLARPSQEGSWCGVVGMPELGAEAAEQLGVDLSRMVLIPEPGPRWLAVTATVADVLPVVAVRPAGRVSPGEVSRLSARLRDRGGVLLVQGVWPQAEASIAVDRSEWSGVGDGYGFLRRRALTVSVTSRRWAVPRRARLVLPDETGGLTAVSQVSPVPMRAVG